jgi:acyl-CoA synthetase (AMP-forming)/AMP-acid ligase II/peptidoglycan/LPS O-acetylase OafA/YrhL
MPNDRAGGHLWQIDVVRLLTFTAVIAVHAIAFTELPSNQVAMGALMLLQFGREVFFTLTAFVLVYTALARPVPATSFWRRRFPLVAVPYVTWSAIYVAVNDWTGGDNWSWSHFGSDLLNGTAEYHLYFLLVTMQLYLVFPLLLRFVRWTARRAGPVLVAVAVANLAWLAVLQYLPARSGPMSWFDGRAYELLPTYAMYVLAGAYAAIHFDRLSRFVDNHVRRLLAVAGAAAVVAIASYVAQLSTMTPRQAAAVLQPAMAASSLAALIVVYLAGARWASGRRRGLRFVAVGSEISFGVYLAHPLVLTFLLDHGLGNGQQALPSLLATIVAFVGTVVGASLLALAIRRTPLALPMGGRARRGAAPKVASSALSPSPPALSASPPALSPSPPAAPAPRPASGSSTVAALVQASLARSDHRAVFSEGATGRMLTAGDLARAVAGWQDVAKSVGDARVGLAVADPLGMIGAYLGALAAGVTIAPIDPNATSAEHGSRLTSLGISALVTDQPQAEAAAARAGCDLWRPGDGAPVQVATYACGERRPGGKAALIMASSGTSGAAKTIPLSEPQLLATARRVSDHLELGPAERGYCPLPLFHINALVVGVLASLHSGATLVVDRRFSARSFWATVAEHRVTWLNLVPGIISILADADAPRPEAVEGVRLTRSASAPLAVAILERFERRTGIPVIETYGMTEAASQITANPVDARRPGSVGLPAGLSVRVVDAHGGVVPPGTVGMVAISGESVVDEYWAPTGALPPVRPARGRDGWLVTGDLGHLDQDGYLYLEGRADDVINRSGEKIFPREIEEILLQDPGVAAAGVVGRPHPVHGEEPIAFVVPAGELAEMDDLPERLAARCEELLSRHKRPADIVLTASLPVGPTGKIRRAGLRPLSPVA